MDSGFPQPKNGTSNALAAEYARLLQSQAGLEPVTPVLTSAAERLRVLGLITYEQRRYVRCAFSEDRDFASSNRVCSGRLFLKPQFDENGKDYRCPDCGRTVYPAGHRKKQFQELRAKVIDDGIGKYISGLLSQGHVDIQPVAGASFAWRVNLGLAGVYVCVADYCEHQKLMSLEWILQNPTCYVAVNPRAIERFAPVEGLSKIPLADIVAESVDLVEIVRSQATNPQPQHLPALATPAYSKAAHRPELVRSLPSIPVGSFVIEIGEKTVCINGIEVVAPQAHVAYTIMLKLARAFTEDVFKGTRPNDYLCQTPSEIARELEKRKNKNDVFDQDLARRAINRLQENIEDRLCQAGVATERDSVIQASPNDAKEGYRLNPFKVAIRPLIPQNPKK